MKNWIFYFLICAGLTLSSIVSAEEKPAQLSSSDKMEWWNNAKYGMFVHWGPYALYGGVYMGHRQKRIGCEWIMNTCKIPVMEYKAKASTFNPKKFCADSLVLLAKRSGMKYLVFTTKHHDGFAMFDSDASRFNIVDYTSYGKDIVDQVVQSCRKHGLKFGFYYSQSQDWCNPGGAVSSKTLDYGWNHPEKEYLEWYIKQNNGHWDALQMTKTFEEYYQTIALPQVRELVTRYPDVSMFFFDTPREMTLEQAQGIMKEIEIYPHIIVNDRLNRPHLPGDFKTPEGKVPNPADVEGVYWETCMNIGKSWGYCSWEKRWKDSEVILKNLIQIAARGGNYLLNVGPDADGNIPAAALERLDYVGKWLQKYGEVIYGTQRSLMTPEWGEVTRKDGEDATIYYLCVFNWPEDGKIKLESSLPASSATALWDGSQLKVSNSGKGFTVKLGDNPGEIPAVIKVELKGKLPLVVLKTNTEKYFEIVDDPGK